MPVFGKRSLNNLAQAHPDLQRVMYDAIKYNDFTVICGYRDRAAQDAAYKAGTSKARFGQSPHNFKPSLAVDCVPYPLDWNDIGRFELMGRVIMQSASKLRVPLVWGRNFKALRDYPHFELANWQTRVKP